MGPSGRRGSRCERLAKVLLCVLLVNQIFEASTGLVVPEPSPSSPLDENKAAAQLPAADSRDSKQMEQAAPAANSSSSSSSSGSSSESQETTTSQQSTTTTAATPDNKSSDSSATGPKLDKDGINTLLASKNDAENDLAESGGKPVAAAADSLDTPVDTSGAAAVAAGSSATPNRVAFGVGNRFHYSMSGADSAETTEASVKSVSSEPTSTTTEPEEDTTTQKEPAEETFELHEEASKSETPISSVAPTTTTTTSTTTTTAAPSSSAPESSSSETTEVKYDEKTKSIVIESPAEKTEAKPEQIPTVVVKDAQTTTTAAAPVSTEAIKLEEATKEVTEKNPEPSSTSTSTTSPPPPPSTTTTQAATTTTTTTTTTSTTAKPVSLESIKPVDVPSVVAAAFGSAIGSAFGTAIKPILSSRDKPTTVDSPSSTTTTTTTLKPSTTLKSSSDKWNRWNPSTASPSGSSSSSAPPSTRRRPILPSIRRRFRPYNRLSPWYGVDSYSSDIDRDYMPSEQEQPSSSGRPGLSSTQKPKRRSSTSTTESPPKSSSRRPSSSGSSSEDSDGDDDSLRPDHSRRGEDRPGGHRRRHQHRHHQHHHHNNRNDEADYESHRRRHNNRPYRGREAPFQRGVADVEPSFSRPNLDGFSLFNTGSSGSGFDLLNPFSGWLDDTSAANRPPVRGSQQPMAGGGPRQPIVPSHIGTAGRQPGRNPIPVEGDYNDSPPHHSGPGRDTHIHVHGGSGGRPPIITGIGGDRDRDREDYELGHHGHDCHDHGYDHDHHDHHREPPYRPQGGGRPGRDPYRPTYGGEDSYSGGRPGRPYNRRDESESGSSGSTTDKRERERGLESDEHRPEPASSAGIKPSLLHGAPSFPSSGMGPRRVPSIFSPLESLFGALDDELFSLRSTFIDGAPLRSTPIIKPPQTFVDTIISSPKISMPAAAAPAPTAASSGGDKLDEPNRKPAARDELDEDSSSARSGRHEVRALG